MNDVAKRGRYRPMSSFPAASGFLIFFLLTIVVLSSHSEALQGSAAVERRVWAMGTRLTVTVEAADRDAALTASGAAIHAVEEVENRLSSWRDDSELSRLNNAIPGSAFPISPEMETDLRLAKHWWKETRGAFDPGIASLIEAWDLRRQGRQPSVVELAAARSAAGLGNLGLDPGYARIETAGFGIEEGGFGKGVALHHAANAAVEAGARCVVLDFGGQISAAGDCWDLAVEIADPDRRELSIGTLHFRSGSVATSGNSERGLVVNGVASGHLLDPQTGLPVYDWGSVTVVAPDPVAADCLSTALYVMGPVAGEEWLRGRPEIDAVFVERSGDGTSVTATLGLRGRLQVSSGNLIFLQHSRIPIEEDSH